MNKLRSRVQGLLLREEAIKNYCDFMTDYIGLLKMDDTDDDTNDETDEVDTDEDYPLRIPLYKSK